ncbi:MAG: hypothetical protein HY459_03685 [Parcubacteria group bacterium]|nr:hypothetical protein [Parcubacteria group bacterium]
MRNFVPLLVVALIGLAACQPAVPEALGVEVLEPTTGVAVEEIVAIRFQTTGPVATVRVSVQNFETEVPASPLQTRSLEFIFLLDTLNLENGPAVIEVAVADNLGNEATDRTAVNIRNFFVRTLSPEDLATVSEFMTVDVKTNRLVGSVDIVVYDGFFAKFFEQLVPVDGHVILDVDTAAFTDSKFSPMGVAFVDAYGYFEDGSPIYEETGFDYTDVFFANGNGPPVEITAPSDGELIDGNFVAVANFDPNRVVAADFVIYDPADFHAFHFSGTISGSQLTADIDVSGITSKGSTYLDVYVFDKQGTQIGWDYIGLNLGTELSPRSRLDHPALPQLNYERGIPLN